MLEQRYSRAVLATGPKLAATTPGSAAEGYWLDERHFYFLAEKMEPSIGRIVSVPSLVDCETGVINEVVPLHTLARLLTEHSGRSVDLLSLSNAEFDMPRHGTLAVTSGSWAYLVDTQRPGVRETHENLKAPALYSPDGRYAGFVKGYDLWLKERSTGIERALTTDGARHHCYGQQSETGLSAVSYRKHPFPKGLWSPDSQWFLTHCIDERALPELPLVQHVPPGGSHPLLHSYKFVVPGDPLPIATYVAIHVESGRVVTFSDFPAPVVKAYAPFAGMAWFGAFNNAWILRFDRHFKHVELICLDFSKISGRIVLQESTAAGYLELHSTLVGTPNVRTLERSDEVIWFSERDGWGHLYLYELSSGRLKSQITRGDWRVRDIVHVNEDERRVFFTAHGMNPASDPARRDFCAVNFDGTGLELIGSHDGDTVVPKNDPGGVGQERPFRPRDAHAGVSPSGNHCVAQFNSVDRGNSTEIINLRTRHRLPIVSVRPAPDEIRSSHFAACAADGKTQLYGIMYLPRDFSADRSYPLVDYIYPGPQIAQQPQSFHAMNATQAMALAELGFVTLMLDTRGLPISSRVFHQAGYPELLEPQLADHAAVIRELCKRHSFIDPNRIGIMGYSAGGGATVRALCDYGDLFKVGIAVCGYEDTSYCAATWSDKYRGPPNPPRWAQEANGAAIHKLNGRLLLISGDMDENVPVSQTLALVNALVSANRDFDLLIVPNEGHSVLLTSGYVLRRVWDYFVRHLLGEEPPRNFEICFQPDELALCMKRLMREAQ